MCTTNKWIKTKLNPLKYLTKHNMVIQLNLHLPQVLRIIRRKNVFDRIKSAPLRFNIQRYTNLGTCSLLNSYEQF